MTEFTLFDGKVCSKCGEWKPYSSYRARQNNYTCKTDRRVSASRRKSDGYRCDCKACFNKKTNEYWHAHYVPVSEPKKPGRMPSGQTEAERLQKQREYYARKKAVIRQNQIAYEQRNKEKLRLAAAKRYQERLHIYAARQKAYRAANRDAAREYQRKWRHANPEAAKAKSGRRRARKLSAPGNFTAQEFSEMCRSFGQVCLSCGEKKKLTADHVVPLSRGGSNYIANIQPLCLSCNDKKGTRTIDYRVGYDEARQAIKKPN
jgi:5-methylcytosine-specific restriction endonuclease McrA